MSMYLKRLDVTDIEESSSSGMYVKYVDIVEVVDQDGNPWEPVPGPDPWDDLVKNQSPIIVGNDFAPGTQITGQTGTFTGGDPEVITYRYRWRTRPVGGNWANGAWTNTTNEVTVVNYDIPAENFGYQIQLQSQARDETQDPVLQVLNNSTTKNTEKTTIGTVSVTVNDIEYDTSGAPALTILMNDPIVVVVSISGNASPTYTWAARADYPLMIGTQGSPSTVLTFPSEGPATVTCTITDSTSEEQSVSLPINFYVVNAL